MNGGREGNLGDTLLLLMTVLVVAILVAVTLRVGQSRIGGAPRTTNGNDTDPPFSCEVPFVDNSYFCSSVLEYPVLVRSNNSVKDTDESARIVSQTFLNFVSRPYSDSELCQLAMREYACTWQFRKCDVSGDTAMLPCYSVCEKVGIYCRYVHGISGCFGSDKITACSSPKT